MDSQLQIDKMLEELLYNWNLCPELIRDIKTLACEYAISAGLDTKVFHEASQTMLILEKENDSATRD